MITTNAQVPIESAADPLRSQYPRRWPLVLLGLPAVVAIWSGWVGLAQMAGFGIVHPLPGIADGFELNSAITLPIGVEAYSAYALGAWLSARPVAPPARRFAAWSSLAALGLGLSGQVIYHLLIATGHTKAPTAVVVLVACLPVLVLGAGAALHHLLAGPVAEAQAGTDSLNPGIPVVEAAPASRESAAPARRRPKSTRVRQPRRLLADYLSVARAQLDAATDPTPAWCRQVTGCSAGTSVKLAAALRAERDETGSTPEPSSQATEITTRTKERAA